MIRASKYISMRCKSSSFARRLYIKTCSLDREANGFRLKPSYMWLINLYQNYSYSITAAGVINSNLNQTDLYLISPDKYNEYLWEKDRDLRSQFVPRDKQNLNKFDRSLYAQNIEESNLLKHVIKLSQTLMFKDKKKIVTQSIVDKIFLPI